MRPHSLHSRFKRDLYEADAFALCLPYTATAPPTGLALSLH